MSMSHYTRSVLEMNGFDVLSAKNGRAAEIMAKSHCPDILLLDLGLPDIDGMSVLDSVRSWSACPVIVVSSRVDEPDKVAALECGADDYVVKPFSVQELLARIRVALRHSNNMRGSEQTPAAIVIGKLTADFGKHRVFVDGRDADLTRNEFRIVALLAQCAGSVMTYEEMMTRLWGPNFVGGNQILRVNMANIRRKIEQNPSEPKYFRTEAGVGYRMVGVDEI